MAVSVYEWKVWRPPNRLNEKASTWQKVAPVLRTSSQTRSWVDVTLQCNDYWTELSAPIRWIQDNMMSFARRMTNKRKIRGNWDASKSLHNRAESMYLNVCHVLIGWYTATSYPIQVSMRYENGILSQKQQPPTLSRRVLNIGWAEAPAATKMGKASPMWDACIQNICLGFQ